MAPSSALLTNPTKELLKNIKEQLNEDENRINQDLTTIKEWLAKQPHLPNEWEDACLLRFLRGCSFSLEKTKRKLDMYFTMRTACPEFFENRDITRPELVHITSKALGPTLFGLTPDGKRVSIWKGLEGFESHWINDCIKILTMIGDVRLREETEPTAGDIYVMDASIVTAGHVLTVSPVALKKFIICVQEAYPLKVKEVHIINTSPLVDILLAMTKNFINDKMKKRMYLHKDYTTLYEYIPKYMLPEEYSGTGPSLEEIQNLWIEKLKEYTDWFKKLESHKSNEALRPRQSTDNRIQFGIAGSFRQLNID